MNLILGTIHVYCRREHRGVKLNTAHAIYYSKNILCVEHGDSQLTALAAEGRASEPQGAVVFLPDRSWNSYC